MKKFINFLESLKNNDNSHLIDVIETGFNSCFETSYNADVDKPIIRKSDGFEIGEWEVELNKLIEKRTKKHNIDDFRHLNFEGMYDKNFSIHKAFKEVLKELDIPDIKPKESSNIMERLGSAGRVSAPFQIVHGLAQMGQGLKSLRR